MELGSSARESDVGKAQSIEADPLLAQWQLGAATFEYCRGKYEIFSATALHYERNERT